MSRLVDKESGQPLYEDNRPVTPVPLEEGESSASSQRESREKPKSPEDAKVDETGIKTDKIEHQTIKADSNAEKIKNKDKPPKSRGSGGSSSSGNRDDSAFGKLLDTHKKSDSANKKSPSALSTRSTKSDSVKNSKVDTKSSRSSSNQERSSSSTSSINPTPSSRQSGSSSSTSSINPTPSSRQSGSSDTMPPPNPNRPVQPNPNPPVVPNPNPPVVPNPNLPVAPNPNPLVQSQTVFIHSALMETKLYGNAESYSWYYHQDGGKDVTKPANFIQKGLPVEKKSACKHPDCGLVFFSSEELKFHKDMTHHKTFPPNTKSPFRCHWCLHAFQAKQRLVDHLAKCPYRPENLCLDDIHHLMAVFTTLLVNEKNRRIQFGLEKIREGYQIYSDYQLRVQRQPQPKKKKVVGPSDGDDDEDDGESAAGGFSGKRNKSTKYQPVNRDASRSRTPESVRNRRSIPESSSSKGQKSSHQSGSRVREEKYSEQRGSSSKRKREYVSDREEDSEGENRGRGRVDDRSRTYARRRRSYSSPRGSPSYRRSLSNDQSGQYRKRSESKMTKRYSSKNDSPPSKSRGYRDSGRRAISPSSKKYHRYSDEREDDDFEEKSNKSYLTQRIKSSKSESTARESHKSSRNVSDVEEYEPKERTSSRSDTHRQSSKRDYGRSVKHQRQSSCESGDTEPTKGGRKKIRTDFEDAERDLSDNQRRSRDREVSISKSDVSDSRKDKGEKRPRPALPIRPRQSYADEEEGDTSDDDDYFEDQ